MDVATLQMDPAQAREKLKEYRGRKHKAADTEYQRAEIAYQELAKGTPLVILSDAIAGCPRDAESRPMLAIARADRTQVHYQARHYESFHIFDSGKYGGKRSDELGLVVPRAPGEKAYSVGGYALVPMVPPGVLGNRALSTHFVLWEVEAWADRSLTARPDRDPYLLRRVDADLFAVVGEWELTDVERAVMRGRAGR